MKKFLRAILMALLFCFGSNPTFSQNVYNSVSELSYDDTGTDVTIKSDFIIVGFSAYALLYDGSNYIYVTPAKNISDLGLIPGNSIISVSGYCMGINPPQLEIGKSFYSDISKEVSSLPSPTLLVNQTLTKGMGYVEAHGKVEENEEEHYFEINTGSSRYHIKLSDTDDLSEYLEKEITITGFVWVDQRDNFIYIIDIWEGNKEIDISVSSNPENGGIVWIDNDKGSRNSAITPGSSHSVYAEPNVGWHFVEWTVDGSPIGSENPLLIAPATSINYVAVFEKDPDTFTLSINAIPANGGTVSISDVEGLSSTFVDGSSVTVNAYPAQGFEFDGWKSESTIVSTSAHYSFEIKQNTALTAHFSAVAAPSRVVKFKSADETKGTVSADGYENVTSIETNSTVILRATPVNDYHSFSYWTKNGTKIDDGAVLTYSDNSDAEFIAYFTSAYPVTFNNPGNGTLVVTDHNNNTIKSGDRIAENEKITIKITPEAGFKLSSLTINSTEQPITSDILEYTVSSPTAISAVFTASIPSRTVYFKSFDEKKGTVVAEDYPGLQQIYTDEPVTFKAIPVNENHEFDYWTLNDSKIDAGEEITYTEPEEAHFIAYFKSAYPVNFTSPANGLITVKDAEDKEIISGERINENNTIKIQLTPSNGYRVTSVIVNDVEISHSSDPILYKVTQPLTIKGKVEAAAAGTKIVTVISSDNSKGKAYINTPGVTSQSLSYNGTAELHAEPTLGCKFEGWRQVGTSSFISTNPVYTFNYVSSDIHLEAVFNYIIQTPRKVTVLPSNPSKGSVKIKDEDSNTVTSQRYLTLIATPLTSNDYFVDWTDDKGKVLSSDNEYVYDSEAEAIITANFVSKYQLTYNIDNEDATTVIKRVDNDTELINSAIEHFSATIDEGTRITLHIDTPLHFEIGELNINGKNVVDEYYKNDNCYTFALNASTQIDVKVVPQRHSITIVDHPHGKVSVYREIDNNGLGLGSSLGNGDRTEYASKLYIFPEAKDTYSLVSVKINGIEKNLTDGKKYLEHKVEGDVEIAPVFAVETGITSVSSDWDKESILMVFDLSGKFIGTSLPSSKGIYIIKTKTKTIKVKI